MFSLGLFIKLEGDENLWILLKSAFAWLKAERRFYTAAALVEQESLGVRASAYLSV